MAEERLQSEHNQPLPMQIGMLDVEQEERKKEVDNNP